jgi:hypothetical protein
MVLQHYVDDTFIILGKDLVDEFLGHLNSINTAVQFTVEKESTDGWLSFLDVCIWRNDNGTITVNFHTQETNSHQAIPCIRLTKHYVLVSLREQLKKKR